MSTKLQLDGLSELREGLRNLPADLTREAVAIVHRHADQAKTQIQRAYPKGPTGNLQRMVTVSQEPSAFVARAIVRSRAPHAHLFEFGTGPRRTDQGANRGRMPKAPESQAMIPIAIRTRKAMTADLIELVRKAGFTIHA